MCFPHNVSFPYRESSLQVSKCRTISQTAYITFVREMYYLQTSWPYRFDCNDWPARLHRSVRYARIESLALLQRDRSRQAARMRVLTRRQSSSIASHIRVVSLVQYTERFAVTSGGYKGEGACSRSSLDRVSETIPNVPFPCRLSGLAYNVDI